MTAFGCKADSNDELETGPLIAEAIEKVVCSVRLDVIPLATDLAGGYGDDG